MKEIIVTKDAPAALGPYNAGIITDSFIFTSGQIGIDPATSKLLEGVEAQAKQALKNVESILKAGGCSLKNVVKTTVFVTDLANFAAVNAIYGEAFDSNFPARSCVEVSKLPGGALVEVEAIALR